MAGFQDWISVPKLRIFSPILVEILLYIFYTFYFLKHVYYIE